jgi:transposase
MYYICDRFFQNHKQDTLVGKTYRPYEPDQMFLMPPSLQEWLSPDHMVYFIREILDTIDLTPIVSVYEEEDRGYPPYNPKMMTGILLYGYCNGITSSRKLSRHCQEDVAFRVLAANNQPDFRTISDFRKLHLVSLEHVFVEVLRLCQRAGLVKFGHIALDGTKIKANASKHKAMSYGRMKQEITRLEEEITQLLHQAEETDAHEDKKYGKDKRGDELPAELARRETRLARIQQAKRALEQEAKENGKNDTKKPFPPAPKPELPKARIKTEPDPKTGKDVVADSAQRNFTDPESRIMPYQKTFVQGYNAQLAVDDQYQIIVATDLTNNPTDDELLPAMVSRLSKKPKVLTADAGYSITDENIKYLKKRRIDAYIAIRREKHHQSADQVRGRIPEDLTIKQRMARKLRTKNGRTIYARRRCIVEPVIGQIKQAQGIRESRLRGQFKVRSEWFLVTATHNLRKLFSRLLKNS